MCSKINFAENTFIKDTKRYNKNLIACRYKLWSKKIIKKNMEARREFLGKKDKITLEAHRDSHAHAMDNNSSIEVKGDQNGIYSKLSHHSSSNPHLQGNSQLFFSNRD